MKRTALILLSAALIFSCAKAGENKNASKSPGDYVAKVGPDVITKAEVDKRTESLMESLPDYLREAYRGEEGKKKIVDELVKTELLYLQAQKEGIDKNPEYVSKVDDYKKYALVQLMFEKIMDENAPKSKLTEKDARSFYDKNREKFNVASQIRASHILVKTRAEADKVEKELRAGKDFAALARARSIDATSAKNGGDLGFFSKGQMVPEFEKAAFALKKGEISQPVKSQFGYHIIKVTDRKGGSVVEFAKVKDMILQKLEQDRQQEAFNKYIEKIKKSYPVEINEAAVKDLKDLQKKEDSTDKKK